MANASRSHAFVPDPRSAYSEASASRGASTPGNIPFGNGPMDSPSKDLEAFRARMEEARLAAGEGRWDDARRALEQAIAIDPLQPKPLDALADVMQHLHDPGRAESLRKRAKTLRQEQWQRQVEAEIRGQHELTGSAARHEIP